MKQKNIKFCKQRPKKQQWPELDYIQAPIPTICGINSKGQRINFFQPCQACMDKSIGYYFQESCYSAPFVCSKGEDCLDYYCSFEGCRKDEECPYDWQICLQNKCVDKCALMKCPSCQFGQCLYEQPYGHCHIEKDCEKQSWSCFGTECVDLCERKICNPYQICKNGNCQPTKR